MVQREQQRCGVVGAQDVWQRQQVVAQIKQAHIIFEQSEAQVQAGRVGLRFHGLAIHEGGQTRFPSCSKKPKNGV